jgi:hypothetical protein
MSMSSHLCFYVKYSSEFTEDIYNSLMNWCEKNNFCLKRGYDDSYEGLRIHKFFIFDNWGIWGNRDTSKEQICYRSIGYGVDNNPQSCKVEYSIQQIKNLINYEEPEANNSRNISTVKVSWIFRALNALNFLNERKLGFCEKAIIKRHNKEIKIINSFSQDYEKDQEILKELQNDVFILSIVADIKPVTIRTSKELYFSDYDSALTKALRKIDFQKIAMKKKLENFQKEIDKILKEIEIFNTKVSFLSDSNSLVNNTTKKITV